MSFRLRNLKDEGLTILAASAFILLLVGIILNSTSLNDNVSSNSKNTSPTVNFFNEVSPSPTPFPFDELTIPYLRNRNYQSSLGELEERNETTSYTSYLTSYDSDGLRVDGLLTIPKGEEPESGWPAIVFVHGYIPPDEYRTTDNYSSYVDYLARNGFVVFKIDLRGHGSSEGEPMGAYYSSAYIIDTLNARAALQSADFVDEEAVGFWGHSMAGNVLFRSFVAKQDIPAIVIWAGAVYTYEDFEDYRIQDRSYEPPEEDSPRRQYRRELMDTYGEFDPDSEFWQKVVPTNYLDGVTGAIQINHAINDNVVDIRYSRNLMSVLGGTTIEHELNEYLAGGHNITSPAFGQAMSNTVSFFNEHLK